jgi:HNH endonuclease
MAEKVTKAEVDALLSYDPASGVLRWRVDLLWGENGDHVRIKAGTVAGRIISTGHRVICINRKDYLAHHIVWMIMNGEWPSRLDHRNRKPDDNRWDNLRKATQKQNTWNRSRPKNNTSGQMGVCFLKSRDKFRSSIEVDGRKIYLGEHDSYEEAKSVRLAAEAKYFGEFAPT